MPAPRIPPQIYLTIYMRGNLARDRIACPPGPDEFFYKSHLNIDGLYRLVLSQYASVDLYTGVFAQVIQPGLKHFVGFLPGHDLLKDVHIVFSFGLPACRQRF